MDMVWWPEGHHGGSIEFIFTKLINLVSLEQFHHKPMGMYADGHFMSILDTHEAYRFLMTLLK